MDVHFINPESGEYLGSQTARIDPMETEVAGEPRFLIPAGALTDAPPAAMPGKVQVFSEGSWSQVADHRGETWYDGNDRPVVIDFIGDPIEAGLRNDTPPLFRTGDGAKRALVAWADEFTDGITGPVPANEKLSWDSKERAARAVKAAVKAAADPETEVPGDHAMLKAEADLTGEAVEDLADTIIEKADLYHSIVAAMAGLRRKTEALIDAEAAKKTPDPHQYEAILTAAKAEAIAMAQGLGLTV